LCPDEMDLFNLPNPSSCTMTLGSIKPVTEVSTRNLRGGVKGRWHIGLATLPPSVSCLSRQTVKGLTSHNPMGLDGLLQRQLIFLSYYPSIFLEYVK
jgi:hypothetical protein